MTMILAGSDSGSIELAAQRIAAGGLVAFPTETVYGLGARADSNAAVAAIFAAKGRPADHPLIVHLADAEHAARFAERIEAPARRLIEAFWPGPLTVIVRRAPGIAQAAAGGQPSIGLRCPAHPVARALLARCAALGVAGIAAPSANRFGRISPTTAGHVADEFGAELMVLDGGPCSVGIESTIVDCSRGGAVLLRPGVQERSAIEAVLDAPLAERDADAPRASGTLAAHYAPRARLRLKATAALHMAQSSAPGLAVYSRTRPVLPAGVVWRAMPGDAGLAAQALFATLRELDQPGVREIWVEQPPDAPEWEGVLDRLQRAAAAHE